MEKTITMAEQHESHLEPRVARLETGLETLTRNVSEMATSIRENALATNQKIDNLAIAVTQAQAPKKTDWGLFVSAIGLILALGAAVLIPINNAANDNKYRIEQYHQSMVEHMKMDNHPVGAALVQRLEEQLKTHIENNNREFQNHVAMDTKETEEIRRNFREEMESMTKFTDAKVKLVEAQIVGIQGKNDLYIDKLFGRVQELEKERIKVADNEHAELMQWRQKAMGLSTPDAFVPLVPRSSLVDPKK
jgi:hypothetical protein